MAQIGRIIASLVCLIWSGELHAAAKTDFGLIPIPAGTAQLGDPNGDDNEVVETRHIPAFRIMRLEVTNAQFARFVAETGYRTDPARSGETFVWWNRWRKVKGADWRHPNGPQSSIEGLDRHPVMQVSARDADAFCAHYGMRLPSDAEWEYAARGSDGRRYPWGNIAFGAGGMRQANAGRIRCCGADDTDGYLRTSPVGSYTAGRSPFGVLDMAGNVWEWTSSTFPGRPQWRAIKGGGWGNDPYCLRAAYRHGNRPVIGLNMVGFRCAADAK